MSRAAMKAAIANSLHDCPIEALPDAFPLKSNVYVPFSDGTLQPGTIIHKRPKESEAGFLFTVQFEDGGVQSDVEEHELRHDTVAATEGESPDHAIPPSDEQLAALPELRELPPHSLQESRLVGGSEHCGGDLCFPNVTLAHPELGQRMPLFMMQPGAAATFAGATLCHGTTAHHAESKRSPGCAAHVSFAVQTPAATLGLTNSSKDRPAGSAHPRGSR